MSPLAIREWRCRRRAPTRLCDVLAGETSKRPTDSKRLKARGPEVSVRHGFRDVSAGNDVVETDLAVRHDGEVAWLRRDGSAAGWCRQAPPIGSVTDAPALGRWNLARVVEGTVYPGSVLFHTRPQMRSGASKQVNHVVAALFGCGCGQFCSKLSVASSSAVRSKSM